MSRTMKTKWLALVAGILTPLGLQAQTFLSSPWNQSSSAVTTGVDSNGTVFSTAPLNSSVTFNSTITSNTSNPQFLWVPALGALQVGMNWNVPSTTSMGQFSVALGAGTSTSGMCSFAAGMSCSVSGIGSAAIGSYDSVSGTGSIALGNFSIVTGGSSVALGSSYVGGTGAAAIGTYDTANANYSTAMGYETTAYSYNSFVLGTCNSGKTESNGTSSSTAWVNTSGSADPLFEIGDGTWSTPSDAFVIYKDGNAVLQGNLKVAPSGDIPMFTGN